VPAPPTDARFRNHPAGHWNGKVMLMPEFMVIIYTLARN